MRVRTRRLFIGAIGVLSALTVLGTSALAQSPTKIRYALGDVVGIDDLPLLIAVERAKARGVEVEITPFKSEEIATQA
jgi:NitT/TauT family transport system substrate-binding protein